MSVSCISTATVQRRGFCQSAVQQHLRGGTPAQALHAHTQGCCIALQQLGRIHVAAFSDEVLHWEVAHKAIFWTQPVFYGVDVTCLHMQAKHSHFEEVGSANSLCAGLGIIWGPSGVRCTAPRLKAAFHKEMGHTEHAWFLD